jgi:hypothetical protein
MCGEKTNMPEVCMVIFAGGEKGKETTQNEQWGNL